MLFSFRDLTDKVLLEEVRGFIKPLEIELSLEGQKVEEGRVIIGCRAGPEENISNVLHEFAHFIEIDEERCNKDGWGLKYGKWIDNPCRLSGYAPAGWHEFSTNKHIKREIRVWAFQVNLGLRFGLKIDIGELAESSQYLPDIFLYDRTVTNDKERRHLIAAEIEELAAQEQYNLESIIKKFEKKKLKLML